MAFTILLAMPFFRYFGITANLDILTILWLNSNGRTGKERQVGETTIQPQITPFLEYAKLNKLNGLFFR